MSTARRHGLALIAALVVAALLLPPRADAGPPAVVLADADASVTPTFPQTRFGGRGWVRMGGSNRWRSYLRFRVGGLDDPVRQATLVLRSRDVIPAPVVVRVATARGSWRELSVTDAGAPRPGATVAVWRSESRRSRRLTLDVTRAVKGKRVVELVLTSTSDLTLEMLSAEIAGSQPRLIVQTQRRRPAGKPRRPVSPSGPAPIAPASPSAPASPASPASPGAPAPPSSNVTPAPARPPSGSVWITSAEIAARPMAGPSWGALKDAADAPAAGAKVADQNSDHDVDTLAVALVAARTGSGAHRRQAESRIAAAIGTETGGRVLALGRNLASYVVAADVLDLATSDPELDARFRAWLTRVRTKPLNGGTLISRHETYPNNWGTMAGASRIAADAYLGDRRDLARAAAVFRGWLGDRMAHTGFVFGSDLSWHANRSEPLGVNPPGSVLGDLSVDGALPDDMRRGCSFRVPPCRTSYAWEAMQGAVVQAHILSQQGYDAWTWSDRALLRAATFLAHLDDRFGGWWATGDDQWQPWLINHAYGTSFPASKPAQPGKVMGWTDWMYAG